jgi:hypothetical protein
MIMTDPNRPLLGLTVGLSAAQSEDATDPGFHADELNRSVIRITQRLLAAGARIVVGHDWRKGGVMETLLKSPAIEHAASIGKPGQWAIVNLVPDRREAAPVSAEMEDYSEAGILHVENVGLPTSWYSLAKDLPQEHVETARASLAIMHLRVRMEQLCDARICIGGKTRGFSGFYPGVLEEGWRTASSGKPLYVTALLGGASRLIAQASGWEGETKPDDFHSTFEPASRRVATYELLCSMLTDEQRRLLPDRDLLPAFSIDSLNVRAGLTKDDWNLLIEAPTADAVGVMTIRGLAQVNRTKTELKPRQG